MLFSFNYIEALYIIIIRQSFMNCWEVAIRVGRSCKFGVQYYRNLSIKRHQKSILTWGLMIEQKPKSVPKKGSRLVVLGGSVYAPYLHTPNQNADLNHVINRRTNRKVGLIQMTQWETNQKVDLLHETSGRTKQDVGFHHVTTGRANQNVEFLPSDQSKNPSEVRSLPHTKKFEEPESRSFFTYL